MFLGVPEDTATEAQKTKKSGLTGDRYVSFPSDMGIVNALRVFILSYFNTLKTTLLAFLLLLLEKLVENDFSCPEDPPLAFIYSVSFFLVPFLILLFLGCKFSDVQLECKSCCSGGSCCKIYTTVRIWTVPLFWLLILLIDGRYVDCLITFITGRERNPRIKPIAQIAGLVSICVFIGLILFLSDCKSKGCIKEKWYQQKYEYHVRKEVEEGIRKKAKRLHESYMEELIHLKYPDKKFNNDTIQWFENVENIVIEAKAKALEDLNERAQNRYVNNETSNTNAQEPTNGSDTSGTSITNAHVRVSIE